MSNHAPHQADLGITGSLLIALLFFALSGVLTVELVHALSELSAVTPSQALDSSAF
jgi:hypothetical protein